MSWLLLLFGAWSLLCVVGGFFPVRRNRMLFMWSFANSWLATEAAPLWLVLEVVLGALLIALGALGSPAGWIGLVMLAVSWVGLAVLVNQGWATAGVAAAAFEPLGIAEFVEPADGHMKVTVDRNIEYRRASGKRQRLDVYRPTTPGAPGERRPVVMQIHGGAWVLGDKREQGVPLLRLLAARGWVGFNVNYRLSPGATFPDHLIDLKAALAWIRAHADDYGIDPDFVMVTGGSAGGHLTAMMALTAGDPRYQPGFEDADTSVQVAVPFYGVYDFTNRNGAMSREFLEWIAQPLVIKAFLDEEPEKFRDASPIDLVHAGAPPFLIIHGDKDTLAPVTDARLFAERLRSVSHSTVAYLELHGAQHAFDVFRSPRTRRIVRAVARFADSVRLGIDTDVEVVPGEDAAAPGRAPVER